MRYKTPIYALVSILELNFKFVLIQKICMLVLRCYISLPGKCFYFILYLRINSFFDKVLIVILKVFVCTLMGLFIDFFMQIDKLSYWKTFSEKKNLLLLLFFCIDTFL